MPLSFFITRRISFLFQVVWQRFRALKSSISVQNTLFVLIRRGFFPWPVISIKLFPGPKVVITYRAVPFESVYPRSPLPMLKFALVNGRYIPYSYTLPSIEKVSPNLINRSAPALPPSHSLSPFSFLIISCFAPDIVLFYSSFWISAGVGWSRVQTLV